MKLLFIGVIVDFLVAPNTPFTQREKQPGTGRWTPVIQSMAEQWRLHQREQHTSRGGNDPKDLLPELSNTTEIFKTLWFCLHKTFIIKKHKPSKTVYPVLFSMTFLLRDAFCYQQQRGHRSTKLPSQGRVSDSELEAMKIPAGYHVPFPSYRSTTYFQTYWRCNEQKCSSVLKNPKIHVCTLLPLQTYSLDLLAELATRALPNLFQSK